MTNTTKPGKPIPGGVLIAFEGIDGSGKTSAARNTVLQLQREGYQAVYLKEPTDGPYGQKLRQIMVSPEKRDAQREFELFLLDRQDDVENNIMPVLNSGGVVCIDRYYISSMAYQGALGLDMDMIRTENEAFAPQPNLILHFEVDIDRALARIHASRAAGANQFEKRDYLKQVDANFKSMDFRQMVHVPANEPQEKVLQHTWKIVAQYVKQASGQGQINNL